MRERVRRILVFRVGSIGDFVIALPSLHLVRRTFPQHEIILLTNHPADPRTSAAESVLENTGLVDRYISYRSEDRSLADLTELRRELRELNAELLVYLAPTRGRRPALRDWLFFRSCGIRRFAGLPRFQDRWSPHQPPTATGLHEPEAQRLGRRLRELGEIDFEAPGSWDLCLTPMEKAAADAVLAEQWPTGAPQPLGFLGFSVGAKQAINDWGDQNWRAVLEMLRLPGFGLVLVGAAQDRQRSEDLARAWSGPVSNLCGRLSPRLSAAVLRHARLFLCHDSGPMHLAAAVGTPCVAVFSRKNPPGEWFPFGAGHSILYPTAECGTIASITPRQVVGAVGDALQRTNVVVEVSPAV